jgi:hypothetical protein
MHRHAGLVKSVADYEIFMPGTPFVMPPNPGHYPARPIPAVQCAQQEAEHKALIVQFQTSVGVAKGLKDLILTAVDEDFLLELQDEGIAYLHVMPFQMLMHLPGCWGSMDYADITALLALLRNWHKQQKNLWRNSPKSMQSRSNLSSKPIVMQ